MHIVIYPVVYHADLLAVTQYATFTTHLQIASGVTVQAPPAGFGSHRDAEEVPFGEPIQCVSFWLASGEVSDPPSNVGPLRSLCGVAVLACRLIPFSPAMGPPAPSCSPELAEEWLEKPGAAEACSEANPVRQCFRRARSSTAHRALIEMLNPGRRGRLLGASVARSAVEPMEPGFQLESRFLVPATTARPQCSLG